MKNRMDAETRQRLLELAYDLLPEAEAAELRRQIESDPNIAKAYGEAQETAKLLAEAARLPTTRIPMASLKKNKKSVMSTSDDSTRPQLPAKAGANARKSFSRVANWAVGLAAAVLVLISVGGYFYHRKHLSAIAAEHLRLVVTGPSSLSSDVPTEYTVSTTAIDGRSLLAQVEVALMSSDGKRLKSYKETADQHGRLQVSIPPDLKFPAQTQLKVVAWHGDSREEATLALPVEPGCRVSQLSLDRPLYQPGETIYYRSLTLSRFGLTADRPIPVHFEILDPGGAMVPGSPADVVTRRGVGNGAFTIPEGLAGGKYTLVVRSADGSFPEERRSFFIRRYRLPRLKKQLEFTRDSYAPGDRVTADFEAQRTEGGAAAGAKLHVVATVDGQTAFEKNTRANDAGALRVEFQLPEKIDRGDGQLLVVVDDGGARETVAKTIPINLGKVKVTFYPEGGDLAAGLENRVYFVCRDPLGKPVHVTGKIVAKGPEADSREEVIATVETTHEGMGTFSLIPRADETYRLKITSPPGTENEPALPEATVDQEVVLTTGAGVYEAKTPLEFNVRVSKAGLPLVAAAYCRGVQVGQQPFVTRKNGSGANPVSIALDDAVGGVIRLTVYDYRSTPPRPVAERLVYRRPAQKLTVQTTGHEKRRTPGETVDLSLLVTDEEGKPVPAVLGVAVVDDALLNLADDRAPSMTTHFLLSSEIEKPEDLEDANFYLSETPKGKVSPAVALDLLLGTQGWRRFAEKSLHERKERGQDHENLDRLAALGGAVGPPAMYDNIDQLRSNYEKSLADYEADRTPALNTLTAASFFGGLGLVLLVAMLGVMRIVSGVHLWIPAVGATTCCLILGAILMDPERQTSGRGAVVAFLPYQTPKAKIPDLVAHDEYLSLGKRRPGEKKRGVVNLFFKPMGGKLFEDKDEKALMMMVAPRIIIQEEEDDFPDTSAVKQLLDKRKTEVRVLVRQYAHRHVAGQPGVRSDFAETLFWHPMLIADADGKASIHFDLSDAVTTFRVTADAHGAGRLGSGQSEVVSRIPFNLEPKLPLEVSAGDRIDLPLAVVNDTAGPLPVELKLEHDPLVKIEGSPRRKLTLAAGRRGREYFMLDVTGQKGECGLTFLGTAGALSDAVRRALRIVPPGFPKHLSYGGRLDGPRELVVKLPESWVPGSLEVSLSAFPSTLADLQQGVAGILREPNGCFEQASTSNYPNVMTMQYMQQRGVVDPEVTRRTKDLLGKGYSRLTGYECKQQGYEWFGGDPGHEALTAYGLMQFRDMQQVHEVDPAMLQRTAEWLLARRDGHGGFQRNPKALDSFGRAPADVTDAYIIWALSESGQKEIEAEVEHALELGDKSDDPYVVALAAAVALNADKQDQGRKLLEKLAKAQADDGHLEGTQGSITRSGGLSLQVETTALAALAWLKSPEFAAQAEKAVEWIVNNRQGNGGFGSTQATILALKVLVQHAKTNRKTSNAGKLLVQRDGQLIGQHSFSAGVRETISIDGLEANLKAGDNQLTISLTGNNKLPYAMNVSYRTLEPENSPECPVRLTVKLAKPTVAAGETVALTAELTNATNQGQPMTVAVVGLPAGLKPRAQQLEELKKAGAVDYYETRARELIFYWRSLAPKRQTTIKLDLVATVPGRYTGPASRTYLYYTPEHKQWCAPLEVEISRDTLNVCS